MSYKETVIGEKSRKDVINGALGVRDAVGVTLGAGGRNVLIQRTDKKHTITKDGVTVARAVGFMEHQKDMGADLIKDVAIRTNGKAGDGTTTSIILAGAVLEGGQKLINLGANPIELKKGMEYAVNKVCKRLKELATPIKTRDDIKSIATIALNNDEENGEIITRAFEQVGDDGEVSCTPSSTEETSLLVQEGYTLKGGYTSSGFISGKGSKVSYNNCLVYFNEGLFDNVRTLTKILNEAVSKKKACVIITEEFSDNIQLTMLQNFNQKKCNCVLIKTSDLTTQDAEFALADLLHAVNGKLIDKDKEEIFATEVERIEVTSTKTTFFGVEPSNDIKSYIDKIAKSAIPTPEKSVSIQERNYIQNRIARLAGGVATIFVGSFSKTETEETLHRFEDAINSVKSAMREGIVAGGGSTLLHISQELKPVNKKSDSFNKGVDLIKKVIRDPFIRILRNAHIEDTHSLMTETLQKGYPFGVNCISGKIVNLIDEGIIDPVIVTTTALRNSVSAASMILTVDCTIYLANDHIHTQHTDENLVEAEMVQSDSLF